MDFDKRILEGMQHVTREEREAIMATYEILKNEPQTKLYMAILREAVMYREMNLALLMKFKSQITRLEYRITELEEKESED